MTASDNLPKVIFHGVAASIMNHGYKSLGGLGIDAYIGGHFQYLTIQGLVLTWLTMVAGLTNDAFPTLEILQVVKRNLMIVSMPLAVVISSIYWPLMLFFPTLIMQTDSSENSAPTSSPNVAELFRIPLTVDLALHAVPALSILMDFFLFEKKYTKKEVQVGVPTALSAYAVAYGLWVEYCATRNNGIFPYPFLTDNTLPVRIGIYLGATAIGVISFRLFNYVHQ